MKHRHHVDHLAKVLIYILGRQPDEFGLVPDERGYVSIKALLQALAEEPGWGHIRLGHLQQVVHGERSSQLEMDSRMIRATDRQRLPVPTAIDPAPTLLFHPVRRRAHPVILEKGVVAHSAKRLVLCAGRPWAERLGRRCDSAPVILTVNGAAARRCGVTFWRFGENLYLADRLPVGSFEAPPLTAQGPPSRAARPVEQPPRPKTPGSFIIDRADEVGDRGRTDGTSRQAKNAWKRERRRRDRQARFG